MKYIVWAAVILMIPFFQNCQKVSTLGTGSSSSEKAEGQLVAVDDSDDSDDNGATACVGENCDDDDDDNTAGRGGRSCDDDDDDVTMPCNSASCNSGRKNPAARSEPKYLCHLEQGAKIGYTGEKISSVQGVAHQAVCMSKLACEEIVAQKFQVKDAKAVGVCNENGNPHVIHLDDAKIEALINAI